jgi:hypothetical protein
MRTLFIAAILTLGVSGGVILAQDPGDRPSTPGAPAARTVDDNRDFAFNPGWLGLLGLIGLAGLMPRDRRDRHDVTTHR